jgi:RHH-type proline utilization regulon transcriptional repressor/proline dehydrogenase/delta 1-pyrroline-5-carboxylate dehydrogenase
VQPGSFTHLTELFGPVLGVMPYKHLSEAIQRVHQTGYGLTSGLESLDDREQSYWSSRMRAGNLYINRPTTGAIVLRQPFGGLGKSAFGPGIKAGGPNYVLPLMHHPSLATDADSVETQTPQPLNEISGASPVAQLWQRLAGAADDHARCVRDGLNDRDWSRVPELMRDYERFAQTELQGAHDSLRLIGQDNLRRYLPLTHVRIRVTPQDQPLEILARLVAAKAAGSRAVISSPPGNYTQWLRHLEELTHDWGGAIEFLEETDEQVIRALAKGQIDRLRYASPQSVPLGIRIAANEAFVYVADTPVSPLGHIELLWYVQEQSLSIDYHRYGNLGGRSAEPRGDTL